MHGKTKHNVSNQQKLWKKFTLQHKLLCGLYMDYISVFIHVSWLEQSIVHVSWIGMKAGFIYTTKIPRRI